eukprot:445983-Pelagomonas_calceolata.AAC.4
MVHVHAPAQVHTCGATKAPTSHTSKQRILEPRADFFQESLGREKEYATLWRVLCQAEGQGIMHRMSFLYALLNSRMVQRNYTSNRIMVHNTSSPWN